MNYRILTRITALVGALMVFAALATSAQAATVAPAAAKLAAEKAVVAKVATAANPQAAFQSLSPSEQALYADSLTHLTVTTIASGGGALPASPGVANRGGCWYHYQFDSYSDLTFHTGDTWMQLNWCSNGPSITSYHTSNIGGRGASGNRYLGVVGQNHLNAGWEIRAYVEFHFTFYGMDAYPCMQIRGGHTGLYSQSRTCNLN